MENNKLTIKERITNIDEIVYIHKDVKSSTLSGYRFINDSELKSVWKDKRNKFISKKEIESSVINIYNEQCSSFIAEIKTKRYWDNNEFKDLLLRKGSRVFCFINDQQNEAISIKKDHPYRGFLEKGLERWDYMIDISQPGWHQELESYKIKEKFINGKYTENIKTLSVFITAIAAIAKGISFLYDLLKT